MAGDGLAAQRHGAGLLAWGIAERVDDYCATAYVYCRRRRSPCRASTSAPPLADIERRPGEVPHPMELMNAALSPP